MELKKYSKEANYSYAFGMFPVMELLSKRNCECVAVYYHSKLKDELVSKLKESFSDSLENNKLVEKFRDKEQTLVIGVFKKYKMALTKGNHTLLDNPANMGNLGTIIRTSLGFGVKNIAIIEKQIDFFDPKVVRASMGAIFGVNIVYYSCLGDYLKDFPSNNIYSLMLDGSTLLSSTKVKEPYTMCFGNEGSGLSSIYKAYNPIRIEQEPDIDSLNIECAVSVALHKAYMDK